MTRPGWSGVSMILVCGLVTGCAVGPAYKRPSLSIPEKIRGQTEPTPAEASGAASPETGAREAASFADQAWWEIFRDDTLKSLIEEALRNGYDVQLAAWRVEEARANAGIARSEYFPAIQGSAGWTRGRLSGFTVLETGTVDLTSVNAGVSWEIDLWGRVRRLNEAARARYLATEDGRRGVLLSLASDVATEYFRLRELDFQLEIARRTAGAFQETHDLFTRRFEAGTASSLETSSAEASLATTTASIPDLERRIEEQENLLAFLLGRNPEAIPRGDALNDQILPPEIPSGIPSDLLKRRPDLRQAEQELVAANADVGVAVANYFPTISLTGAFGGISPQVSDLFHEGKAWAIGGGLLTPIFQGGRLKDEHRAALARWEQARTTYEKSVNNAFAEVSTALVAYQKLADVEKEQARAVAAHRDAVSLSNSRYLSGLSDYLEVLQAQQQLFPAENALAETRFERLATLVQLYRALGGGWKKGDSEWATQEPRAAAMSTNIRTAE